MIATVVMICLAALGRYDQGLFGAMFPNPTGKNGLEDYVIAWDLMESANWSAYADWVQPEVRADANRQQQIIRGHLGQGMSTDTKLLELTQRLNSLTMLQVRQEEAAAFLKSRNLLSQGNEKPCYAPIPIGGAKSPTVNVVFGLVALALDDAYVHLSESKTDKAIQDLADVLILVDHACRSTYVQGQIATISQLKVCTLISENLQRFSLTDAYQIEALANEFLTQPPGFVDAYRSSIASSIDGVAVSIRSLKGNPGEPARDKAVSAFNQVIGAMPDAEVDQLIRRVQQTISNRGQAFLTRFNGPEQAWLPAEATVDSPLADPVIRTPADVEEYFSNHWGLPEITRPRRLVESLRVRAMMRLIRLHARVLAFRWEQGRLPTSLEELALPTGYEFDPLSNGRFEYRIKDDYCQLYSSGNKLTGKVELGGVMSGGGPANVGIKP